MDGDDCVSSEDFRKVLEQIRHCDHVFDVYMFDYYRFDCRSCRYENHFIIPEKTILRGEDSLNQILDGHGCFWNVWRFIYNRTFLEINNLFFLENYLAEDIDYTTKVLLARPDIVFIHDPYYIYYVGREKSLMENPTIKNLEDTIFVLQRSIILIAENSRSFSELVCTHYQFEYFLNLALLYEIPKEVRPRGRKVFADIKSILSIGSDPVIKTAEIVYRILGLNLTAYVLHFFKILKRKKQTITAVSFFRNHFISS